MIRLARALLVLLSLATLAACSLAQAQTPYQTGQAFATAAVQAGPVPDTLGAYLWCDLTLQSGLPVNGVSLNAPAPGTYAASQWTAGCAAGMVAAQG